MPLIKKKPIRQILSADSVQFLSC